MFLSDQAIYMYMFQASLVIGLLANYSLGENVLSFVSFSFFFSAV